MESIKVIKHTEPGGISRQEVVMRYKITYHMYPAEDVVLIVTAPNEEQAIVLAKAHRSDAFSIEMVDEQEEVSK